MITIEYFNNVSAIAVPDIEAERFVLSLKDGAFVSVSTANVIFAARALSVEKNIPIQFMYNNEIIKMNEYGAIHHWPKGFCDRDNDWTLRVVKFAMEKRKREKENGK